MRFFLTSTIVFIIFSVVFGENNNQTQKQEKPEHILNWLPVLEKYVSETETLSFLTFKDAVYDAPYGLLPIFYKKVSVPASNIKATVSLKNPSYKVLSPEETTIIESYLHIITEDVKIDVSTSQSRSSTFSQIIILPFRKNPSTGNIEKLLSFDLEITYNFLENNISSLKKKSYKTNSVLASGDIYKFCVNESGVHKITYSDLEAMGVNVSAITPKNIRIYGNGGGMLSESNADFRYDDLVENAIFVEGENNGVFNSTDYILFFAESPNKWYYDDNEKRFQHQIHHYSDATCYFFTADHGQGKRIETELSSTSPSTHSVNTFNDFSVHENNTVNLIHSGKEWFGEVFDIQTEHNFSFSFSNILSGSKVRIKSSLAARSFQNSSFSITAGGLTSTVLIPSVPASYTSGYARMQNDTMSFNASSSSINVNVKYNKPSNNSTAWLNYIQLNVERHLTFSSHQMAFRNVAAVGAGHITEYTLSNASNTTKIWDITNPAEVKNIEFNLIGNQAVFRLGSDSLRTFCAYGGQSYLTPVFIGKIPNQNLHGLGQYDMIIVTHPLFLSEAQRLALAHYNVQDLSVVVATTDQIYNEFSSGMRDISAIRDFVKMFYDRASTPEEMPKYLLLFGDGSYDNKNRIPNNTNFIPTYQSANSLEPTVSYVTDDFFGLLDDNEGLNANGSLDVGIGRFPVRTVEEARNAVDKTILYMTKKNLLTQDGMASGSSVSVSNYGDWRNVICFIADDEDGNLHISQAESLALMVDTSDRNINIDKIYLDAYLQQTNAGGQRYPEVNDAINNRVQKGALIINYTGHGGELGWAHERVLEVADINAWRNKYNMPVFVTATCEFSRFDDPKRISAGEYVFLNPNGGGAALFSTSRLAFANTNFALNKSFYSHVFKKENNAYYSLGDLMRLSKNAIGNISSIRNFVLLGDPALKLSFPEYNVVTTVFPDTMKALSKVTIEGYIADHNGLVMDDFNGTIFPTIFDKPSYITTLANDPGSQPFTFKLQKNILFKGKASVVNGFFSFEFIVPKDIAYQYDNGKISYYAEDGLRDANGSFEGFIIGGFDEDYVDDNRGPVVKLYMNNENFVFGGITDKNPVLLALLFDESGINTTGNGVGHDITAVLDDNTNRVIVLNDFYQSDLDSYKSGRVVYPFYNLDEGLHTLLFKVWDVHNNSSESYLEFYVTDSEDLAIEHLMNYPNPFNERTYFIFEHNQSHSYLNVEIQIVSLNGTQVKTIKRKIYGDGFKTDPIEWNGTNESGQRIDSGMYVYRLIVTTEEGHTAEKTEKLIFLK